MGQPLDDKLLPTGHHVVADPAGKIGQMTQLTLRDLPKVDAAAAARAEGDDDVVGDVESLLKDDKK